MGITLITLVVVGTSFIITHLIEEIKDFLSRKVFIVTKPMEDIDVLDTSKLIRQIVVHGLEEKDKVKPYSLSDWEEQDKLFEQRRKIWRDSNGNPDNLGSNDETCSPLIPNNPKTPLNLGGYRKLEDEEGEKSI